LSKNLKSIEIDNVLVTIRRHKDSKYFETSLSNIFVQCILKYRTMKPLKIPHKYGSTSQLFFLHCLGQKRLLRYNARDDEVRFLVWCSQQVLILL